MIRILYVTILLFCLGTLSAQNTTPTEDPAKSMEDAMSEMTKMLDTMDLSNLMKGLDLNSILGDAEFGSMFEMMDSMDLNQLFGERGLDDLGMGNEDIGKMMEESMKMLEGMDMSQISKMMEGIDMSEMMKALEGIDMSEMMKMFEGINPEDFNIVPPTLPSEEDSKRKKMKKL